MARNGFLARLGLTNAWAVEIIAVLFFLAVGIGVMPSLIFYGGVAALGKYEGASLGHLYNSLLAGLAEGSIASWSVFLGPYAFYLLFKGLQLWWRASARLA